MFHFDKQDTSKLRSAYTFTAWRRPIAPFKLYFTFVCLLALSACQNSAPADVAEISGTDTSPETATTGSTIPDQFIGTWDKDDAGCSKSKSSSFTQVTVSPTEIYWFGGRGEVIAVRGDGNQVEADLAYQMEGSPTSEPEPTTTTVALDAANRLSVRLGGDLNGLIRCDETAAPGEVPSPTAEDDKMVTVQFSPCATSATFSDHSGRSRSMTTSCVLRRASDSRQRSARRGRVYQG